MRGPAPLHSATPPAPPPPLARNGHHFSQPSLLPVGGAPQMAYAGPGQQPHGHHGQLGSVGQPNGIGHPDLLRHSSPLGRQMVPPPQATILQGPQRQQSASTPGTPMHPGLQPPLPLHVEAFKGQPFPAAFLPAPVQAPADVHGAECFSPRNVHFGAVARQSSAPQPASPRRSSSADRPSSACAPREESPRPVARLQSSVSTSALGVVARLASGTQPVERLQLGASAELRSTEVSPQKSVMPRAIKTKEPRASSPRTGSPRENRTGSHKFRGGKKDEAVRRGPVKVVEEDFRKDSRQMRERVRTFDKASVAQHHSPRDDRLHGGSSNAPRRNSSQPNLVSESLLSRAHSGTADEDIRTQREELQDIRTQQLQREVQDVRQENTRLQDKLTKAKSLVLLLQKQADEARSERDREHRRSEELQVSVQHLQRQLRREGGRSQQLERQLSAAAAIKVGEHGQSEREACTRSLHASLPYCPVAAGEHAQSEREVVCEVVNRGSAKSGCVNGFVAEGSSVDRGGSEPQLSPRTAENALDQGDHDGPSPFTPARPIAQQQVHSDLRHGGASSLSSFERSWEFVVQGQHDHEEQHDFAPKLVSCFPEDALERAWSRGVACVCTRGRRQDASVPNQDDFLIARHTLANDGYIALYGIFDGHGPAGHHCAAFTRGSLPESLFGQHSLLMKPEDTLRQAFRQTQQHLLDQPFDTKTSGTTAALALVLNIPGPPGTDASAGEGDLQRESQVETWLFVAHVGDSRIILASHKEDEPSAFSVTTLTGDHRPDDDAEADRIRRESRDGDVRKVHKNSSAMRVFSQSQNRPVSALTRTLGASGLAECGVISEPEITAYRLRPGIDVLLLMGSDGLFEFCSNADAVSRVLREGVTVAVLEDICGDAREQWSQNSSNETVDDITAIAISLPSGPSGAVA